MDLQNTGSDHTQQRLTDLRNGLLRLHGTLLESERKEYDHNIARINSPGQLLGLVLNDPFFGWLRELSRLVVTIDEILDAKEPATISDADRLVREARTLIAPSEQGTGFAKQYFDAMQRDPNVILAHAETSKLLARLARPQ
jgi:hypothetical protein